MRARGLWVAVAVVGVVGAGFLFACGRDSGGTYAGGIDASIDQTTGDAPPPDNFVGPDVVDAGGGTDGNVGVDAGCEQTCTGACCNGVCLGAVVRDCAGCAGLPYYCTVAGGPTGDCVSSCGQNCNGAGFVYDGGCVGSCEALGAFECGSTCVTDCSQCDGGLFGCTACSDGGSPVIAQCQPNASDCPVPGPNTTLCLCSSADAGECYGQSQVCLPAGGGSNGCFTCGQNGGGAPNTDNATCKNGNQCDQASGTCSP